MQHWISLIHIKRKTLGVQITPSRGTTEGFAGDSGPSPVSNPAIAVGSQSSGFLFEAKREEVRC